jgi:hypothetical protein
VKLLGGVGVNGGASIGAVDMSDEQLGYDFFKNINDRLEYLVLILILIL